MISFTQQQTIFGDLSQNTSSANLSRGAYLANIEQRYLLQKYFNNEGSFTITTVGAQDIVTTGALSVGAISATLTTAWAFYTTTVNATFSSGEIRPVHVVKGSTAISWDAPLVEAATTAIEVGGLQYYPTPPNYSKLKTITITVGQLQWTLKEVLTREEWDNLNVFPYYADIPAYFYLYPGGDRGGQVGIYPIPSSTGNLITFNYKFRIPDLSLADYATGTVSVTKGSTTVTGSGTSWTPTTNPSLESRWIRISETAGDNLWYQVAAVNSTTSITLYQPYQGITVSGGSYILGQMPILNEDFQDMLVWKPLIFYFTSIVDNKTKVAEYRALYAEKVKQLEEYSGSKTINVNLGRRPTYQNPNLYGQDFGATP